MKKYWILLTALFLLLACILPGYAAHPRRQRPAPVPPSPPYRAAVVMDAATGRILFQKNADEPIPPASLTKVLALYLAFEAVQKRQARWRDPVRISRLAWRTGGSRMFVEPGTDVPLGDLVLGMAVVSANDATVAVAEHLGGTAAGFVAAMNAKARELGMVHSCFANPHGLPARGQMTTAGDMLKLARAYLKHFPAALTVHSRQHFTYHKITQPNRNRLLRYYPGTDGLKTGYVCASGYHLIATARRGNCRLIAVVLGAGTPAIRTRETMRLLDEGFSRMGVAPLPSPVQRTAVAPVQKRVARPVRQ